MADAMTRPAPASEDLVEAPVSSRVTPLARAALELGVDSDDVMAYLVGRDAHRRSAEALARV